MKKTIQILVIIILVLIIALIVVAIFNPFNLRTKMIGSLINSYLSSTIEGYTPVSDKQPTATEQANPSGLLAPNTEVDKHPLLNESQEKQLESYGVNVEQLPSSITPGMEACFIEKLGQERSNEIVAGDSPSAFEVIKARECLGK